MAVYQAVYGSYYEYETISLLNDTLSLFNVYFGFMIGAIVILIFIMCFNRNT